MPTTSYGYELTIGDETDSNDTPLCCDNDMTGENTGRGYRKYTCDCGSTVTIAPNGLVFDITD